MIESIVAAVLLLGGGTYGAYRFSGVRRKRSAARREREDTEREIGRTEEVLESRRKAVDESSRRYLNEHAKERLEGVSLDTLREQTDGSVKIAPLERAGFATVSELVGKNAADLKRIKGIGAHSSRKIEKAVRDYLAFVHADAPPLPKAELARPSDVELGRNALAFLEAWRELGDAPGRLRKGLVELDEKLNRVDAGFASWLGGVVRKGFNRKNEEKLDELGKQFRALRESDAFRQVEQARHRLANSAIPGLGADAVRELFARDYADACALLERLFTELGIDANERRASRPGAAPAQAAIVRQVEGFPLRIDGLKVILRGYQAFGARFVLAMRRTVLGDEMGLGKTIQALAVMTHLDNEREYCAFLVTAPASILGNWRHEIETRTGLSAQVLHGEDLDHDLWTWREQGGVGITSYATLRNNLADFAHKGPEKLALVVADEAHYIKNPDAGRTKALVRISDTADFVCFMSGTPLENHPEEFVHLLGSLAPDRARDLGDFLKQPGAVLGGARHFHAEVADVYLRRNQEDVLKELPEKLEMEEWLDLYPETRAAYEEMVRAGNFMGMRRSVTVGDRTAKFERLAEILDEYRESGVKVLLFSYFLDVLEEVGKRFETIGSITGSVPPEDRFDLVQRFGEAEGHQLLIAQIDAAGTGLNLQAAGAVVLMEPQLKPTTEAQAIARAHRMGQTRRVVVHRLLARDCVDERLVELLREKSELFDQFARRSLIKEASEEATATGVAQQVVAAERERLATP
ncbi:MAG: DEAD/DEAH box helicase [Planctomycetota bacterium]|jgi:superfamily II DNA or RNA helicase